MYRYSHCCQERRESTGPCGAHDGLEADVTALFQVLHVQRVRAGGVQRVSNPWQPQVLHQAHHSLVGIVSSFV